MVKGTRLSTFIILLFLLVISWGAYRFIPWEWNKTPDLASSPIYQEGKNKKKFVVIIPSYNNSSIVYKNLRSVLTQDYDNFRVIYIDDCSKDDTYEKARQMIKKLCKEEQCTLVRNKKNLGGPANLYRAIHDCEDDEIVVCVHGDDMLAHEKVLSYLNFLYNDPHLWMTYGGALSYPSYNKLERKAKIIRGSVRSENWEASHLRTFYAALFKKIPLKSLLFHGQFYSLGWDQALTFPLLEMAGDHAKLVHEVLYLYNQVNPLNEDKINPALKNASIQHARSEPPFPHLNSLFSEEKEEKKADLILFSHDRPLQLYALLESVEHYCKNLSSIAVLYRASNDRFDESYLKVKEAFPYVEFVPQSKTLYREDFRPLLFRIAFTTTKRSPYIVFAGSQTLIKDEIDFADCIEKLEQTQAYGFFLGYGANTDYYFPGEYNQGIPPTVEIGEGIHAWKFMYGRADWEKPHSIDMVIYRKDLVRESLEELEFSSPSDLEMVWEARTAEERMGLFYNESKCLKIPLIDNEREMSHEEMRDYLLLKFEKGKKLDITPLYRFEHNSREHPYTPTFVSRKAA